RWARGSGTGTDRHARGAASTGIASEWSTRGPGHEDGKGISGAPGPAACHQPLTGLTSYSLTSPQRQQGPIPSLLAPRAHEPAARARANPLLALRARIKYQALFKAGRKVRLYPQ